MKNKVVITTVIVLTIIIAISIGIGFFFKRREGLSLSQFPIPECSTCKSCKFYTCGKCGTIYQTQNKLGQPCNCGGFTVYKTPIKPSCYTQYLNLDPTSEGFCAKERAVMSKGSCASCDNKCYTCLEAVGTFDSGTTFMRNLRCPVPFPPVVTGYKVAIHKQSRHISELDVYKYLAAGYLIIAANNGDTVDYTRKKLIEQSVNCCAKGYPNFYYINGPVLVMIKVDDVYYWMIDYPIKYTPENYSKYVNRSKNWNIAKTAYHSGKRLLNADAPFIVFAPQGDALQKVRQAVFACLPQGYPQSNTDFYYGCCSDKSCLWGPEYGSGNWLTQV